MFAAVKRPGLSFAMCAAVAMACSRAAIASPAEEYSREIRPLLEKRCFECHDAATARADLNLEQYDSLDRITGAPEVWQLVLERVRSYEMPPKKSGELGFDEYQKLVEWLGRLPKPPEPDCNTLASDRTAHFYRGYVMSRRLNRAEYARSIRDLVGVEVPVLELLPADGGGGEGFDTTGSALFLSTLHIERYLAAAERVTETVLTDDEPEDPEIRRARDNLLVARPSDTVAARDAARAVVSEFARRAFRRRVQDDEVDRLMALYDRAAGRGDGFVAGIRLALQGVLISPHFLFLAEPEPGKPGIQPLGPYPLASRLSYFLWSSIPDERLLSLAESGALLDIHVYRAEIRRMLGDPKAAALGERFALQWLDVDRVGSMVRPDPQRFPQFDEELASSMRHEVVAFFNHIVREDRPLLELIDSDYTFINERLARLYGLEAPGEPGFQRVSTASTPRGGVLGMAAVHALTSYPLRTSPVLRGHWILEALLGEKVPPPPPGTPTLDPDAAEAPTSLRQQLEQHRADAACAACHDKMDPLGFGLENFDPIGRWRTAEAGHEIDARGTLPSGETFDGPDGLRQVLMARKDQVMRHLARKLTGFALGRELTRLDTCVIDSAMDALHNNDYRASALIESIALSFPFRHRFYPKSDS